MNKLYEIRKPSKTDIAVDGDKITISRKGILNLMTVGLSGEKTIRIKQITSLQLKMGTNLTNGYLQIGLIGDSSHSQGLFNATQDENTIMFTKKYNNEMRELHDYIDNYDNSPDDTIRSTEISLSDKIKELKELSELGIITDDEFNEKRQELLDSF